MDSLESRGVRGGEGWDCDCDCDVIDGAPLEDDCRECLCSRLRDLFGDFWILSGATSALACLSPSFVSKMKPSILG